MSDSAPDVTVDASKTVDNVEDTTKNQSVEELQAELDKKTKVAEDKHNFALKSETEKKELLEKLAKYEEAEQAQLLKKKEEAGEYDALKAELISKAEANILLAEQKEEENKKLREKLEAIEEQNYSETLNKLPEDKKDFFAEKLKDKPLDQRLEMLSLIASQFGTTSSGKIPEAKEKKSNRLDELQAKYDSRNITPSELLEYKTIINK